jgi:hypothetical protein
MGTIIAGAICLLMGIGGLWAGFRHLKLMRLGELSEDVHPRIRLTPSFVGVYYH